MLPPHIEEPPGFEAVVEAEPAPRAAIAPPPDDRMGLARAFVLRDCSVRGAARVLAQRASLGDLEAWEAVSSDIVGPGRGRSWRVAEALGEGDLDTAVAEAARACGETVEEWLRSERAGRTG